MYKHKTKYQNTYRTKKINHILSIGAPNDHIDRKFVTLES